MKLCGITMSRARVLVASALVAGGGVLMVPSFAAAHSNAVACVDPSTSTWRIMNDHPLSETFTSTEGIDGVVAGGAGSFTDVVWNGDSLHVTGTWTDGYVGSTTGIGDCSPEVQPTTTTTILVTTTTAQETTTLVPTTQPPTSSSVASTSTTSPNGSTSTSTTSTEPPPASSSSTPSSAPTTPPPTSTPSAPPTSTPTPCGTTESGAPTSPPPVTPSSPPCGRLPATGTDSGWLAGIALWTCLGGVALMLVAGQRRS